LAANVNFASVKLPVASLRQVARFAQNNLSEQEKPPFAGNFTRKQPKGGNCHSQLQKFP
jgi:hypothetical protein